MKRHAIHHLVKEIMRTFFTLPTTIDLPSSEVSQHFHENYRGRLEGDSEHCVGCAICVRICPIDALTMEHTQNENSQRSYRLHYDFSRCAYCGLCVDSCPHNAIHFVNHYVHALTNKDEAQIILTQGTYPQKKKEES